MGGNIFHKFETWRKILFKSLLLFKKIAFGTMRANLS